MIKPAIPLTPRAWFILALLIILGFLGNYWSLPLFFGVDFILGSIAVLIVVYFYGLGFGVLAAILASSYTYFLWGHPYAVIIFSLEALFVGFFLQQGRRSLLLLDGLYWLIIGMPAVWLFYGLVMHMDGVSTLLIMLKQGVNGIANALLASLAISFLPLRKILEPGHGCQTVSLRDTLFNLLVALILGPALFIMILSSHGAMQDMQAKTIDQLERVSADITGQLSIWYESNLKAVTELAALAARFPLEPSPALQHDTEIIQKGVASFQAMYVADAGGTTVAFSPAVNNKGQSTIGLNFADRAYFKELKVTRRPVLSEVFVGRGSAFSPVVTLSVPILRGDQFSGYALGTLTLERIHKMLEPYGMLRHLSITLTDSQGRVITSTVPDRKPMMAWKRSELTTLKLIQNSVYHWFPGDETLPKMTRWKNSFYVQETTVAHLPWKLVLEAPVASLQRRLYLTYVHNLGLMAAMAVLALLIAMIFNHWLVRPLAGLAQVTTNLPEKLLEHQDILWPESSAAEIDSLVTNFEAMARTLEGNVQELQERSIQLAKANQGLEGEIAERVRMEQALKESETKYRTLVENISLGISLIGSDYKIIMTNTGMGKIFGKPPQEFVGKYCFLEFEKREEVCPHCPAVKAMASGQPMEVDTIGVHDDGTFHYAHVRTFPTFDSLGNATGFVEVVEDTTARRQVEEQLAWEGKVNSAVAELARALLASQSIEDVSQMVLDSAVALTNSSLGFCGFLDPQTGYLILPTLSRHVWEVCQVPDKSIIFKKFAGLWGYGLEHGQPVLTNDPAADPRSSGTPQGHVPIHNFVSVPAMLGDHLLGQLAVANAPRDYSAKDQEVCERLALVYALVIQRQRAEEAVRQSEARFRDIAENVAEWVWEVDPEGKYTFASPVVEHLLGYKPEEVLGHHFYDFFLPDERQALKDKAFALFDAKLPFRDFSNGISHKNGTIVWLSTSGVPVLDVQGNLLGYRGADIDITARRKSQEALEIANTQLKTLLEEADERNRNMALLNDMVDVLQSCRTSAEAFEAIGNFVPKFFPIDAGALYLLCDSKSLLSSVTVWGHPPPSEELFPPDDCWAVRSGRVYRVDDPASALLCKHVTLSRTLATGYLCVPLMAQGTSVGIFHIRFLSCATQGRQADELEAKQRLAVAIAENLSLALANLKLQETLQNQAIRDPLTGLYNRRYLEETMDRELHRSRRLKTPLGVIMMDLDHFKNFNDSFGHGAGDALLSALAHVITAGIRTEDIACRYGGEEFLLVLPGASLETTRERAENVRQAVKALQVKYHGRFLKSTTISLGIAIFPDQGHTAEEVISAADAALYRAKQAGRDRVEIAVSNPPEASAP